MGVPHTRPRRKDRCSQPIGCFWTFLPLSSPQDSIWSERHQPKVLHWLCAHWHYSLELLCLAGPQYPSLYGRDVPDSLTRQEGSSTPRYHSPQNNPASCVELPLPPFHEAGNSELEVALSRPPGWRVGTRPFGTRTPGIPTPEFGYFNFLGLPFGNLALDLVPT